MPIYLMTIIDVRKFLFSKDWNLNRSHHSNKGYYPSSIILTQLESPYHKKKQSTNIFSNSFIQENTLNPKSNWTILKWKIDPTNFIPRSTAQKLWIESDLLDIQNKECWWQFHSHVTYNNWENFIRKNCNFFYFFLFFSLE